MQIWRRVKPKSQTKWVLLLAILLKTGGKTVAQNAYTLKTEQEFTVSGTSTLHDWDMVSSEAKGNAKISIEDRRITSINSLIVTLPTNSLKSGKGGMDDNAYKALDAKQHPNIHFELTAVEAITDQQIKAKGQLSIVGETLVIPLDVNYKVSENAILFEGKFLISFTQFKIDPPKALLGTIKTGDELQISFETAFKSIN